MKKLTTPAQTLLGVSALLLSFSTGTLSAQSTVTNWPQANSAYYVVTAPTSPNTSASLVNAMADMENGGFPGQISACATNPAAVNRPNILRASDIIFGPAAFLFWDATNNPGGAFASENGKRLAWVVDWKDTNMFVVSNIWFMLKSNDGANNTLGYAGNIATNTANGQQLVFSPTLKGFRWNADGTTNVYTNGETILDHPVNRVISVIRLGYYCTAMSQVTSDLSYFVAVMPLTQTAMFYNATGSGVTNSMMSNPWPTAHSQDGNGNWLVTVEGQRQVSYGYAVQSAPAVTGPWSTVETLVTDGGSYTNTMTPCAFYRLREEGVVQTSHAVHQAVVSEPQAPRLAVSNGPE